MAVYVDIGTAAVGRRISIGGARTVINRSNPANASGTITRVEIYTRGAFYNVRIGIFYEVSPDHFTTRDWEAVSNLSTGFNRRTVHLNVAAGEYIGIYWTGSNIDRDTSGYSGMWFENGAHIPCTNEEFGSYYDDDTVSLFGYGVPSQVTGVAATDGTYTNKVRITWNAAAGAQTYYIWNGSSWIGVGTARSYDHTGAPAPTITHGSVTASDGIFTAHVALSNTGASANNGTSRSYKVKAYNVAGYCPDSVYNSGYRGHGALTYQWYRSAGDSNASYSVLSGATAPTHNDTGAPEDGSGRYYKCYHTATGAVSGYTGADRGYRLALILVFLSGIINFTGNTEKKISYYKSISGIVNFIGNVNIARLFSQAISGTLTFVGSIGTIKTIYKSLSGIIAFVGDVGRKTSFYKSLSGVLTFSGNTFRGLFVFLSGVFSFIGNVGKIKTVYKFLSGIVSFVGSIKLKQELKKIITGTLTFVGDLKPTKLIEVLLTGVISFTGLLGRIKRDAWERVKKKVGDWVRVEKDIGDWIRVRKEVGYWDRVKKEVGDWVRVEKVIGNWIKVEKDTGDWTKVEKTKGDWNRVDRRDYGWMVRGWFEYGWMEDPLIKVNKLKGNWKRVGKEKGDFIPVNKERGD